MVYQVELIVHRLLALIGGWMFAFCISVLAAVLVAAFLGLHLFKFDKDSFRAALATVLGTLSRSWLWGLAAAVLLLQLYGLSVLQAATSSRIAQQHQTRYSDADDEGGGATSQRAPSVSFLDHTSFERSIIVPPNAIATPDLNALPGWSPEQARYGGAPAVNVQDELIKDERSVVIHRKTTVDRFVPFKLTRSDVEVGLAFRGSRLGQRRQYYQADFKARYTFDNPFNEVKRLHFVFPLPDNSGTLSQFRFKVNGHDVPPQDISQGVSYERDFQPNEQANVEVAYQQRGSQAWTYDLANRREPIADFHLLVHSDFPDIKFLRGALYPTRHSGGSYAWDLQNQITSQSISLYFSTVSQEEMVRRLFVFCPLGLLSFVTCLLVWARLRHTGTGPWACVLAGSAMCAGAALASYLLDYMPVAPSIVIGFGVAAGLQMLVLGRRLWLPVAASFAVTLAFLTAGDSGLLISLFAVVVLAATILETQRARDVVVAA
jgi:hypothetical protein